MNLGGEINEDERGTAADMMLAMSMADELGVAATGRAEASTVASTYGHKEWFEAATKASHASELVDLNPPRTCKHLSNGNLSLVLLGNREDGEATLVHWVEDGVGQRVSLDVERKVVFSVAPL